MGWQQRRQHWQPALQLVQAQVQTQAQVHVQGLVVLLLLCLLPQLRLLPRLLVLGAKCLSLMVAALEARPQLLLPLKQVRLQQPYQAGWCQGGEVLLLLLPQIGAH